jgi:hypothetical protein
MVELRFEFMNELLFVWKPALDGSHSRDLSILFDLISGDFI